MVRTQYSNCSFKYIHRQTDRQTDRPTDLMYSDIIWCQHILNCTKHVIDVKIVHSEALSIHVVLQVLNAGIILVVTLWGASGPRTITNIRVLQGEGGGRGHGEREGWTNG